MHYLNLLNRKKPAISRRQLIQSSSLLAAAALMPSFAPSSALAQTRLPEYPFKLGVASGDPLSDGFVIWTRLALYPTEIDYGLNPEPLLVKWQVAERANMSNVVREGTAIARPEMGHSVHVELRGLRPDTEYWYKFSIGDFDSRVGRGITAPIVGNDLDRLKFAYVSCQHYERGFYSAYQDLVEQDPRLVVFLGDYIYENDPGRFAVRRHEGPEPKTLEQYRARYSTYKLDENLQKAHAHTCWVFTWDDHEVDNNYAGQHSQDFDEIDVFLSRRAAAYKAYYEMMPLRASARPVGPNMHLYQRLSYGNLLDINILDNRQYRSDHPCDFAGRGVPVTPELCSELYDPSRTILGARQHRWLDRNLANSQATWNVIAQQTLFSEFNRGEDGQKLFSTDGWGGYPVSRDQIVDRIVGSSVSNPVFIGGDVHAYWVSDVKKDWTDSESDTVATEFVGTSVTSGGGDMDTYRRLMMQNPHIGYIETQERGYSLATVTRDRWLTEHRAISDKAIRDPFAEFKTTRSFVVEAGKPGAEEA